MILKLYPFRLCFLACLVLLLAPSVMLFRGWLAAPLVLHNKHARGDLCYVLADGGAIWERLDAAADLVHMGQVSRILLMQDNATWQYSFKTGKSWTRTIWMADYLAWRGVAPERIIWIPQTTGRFGTLTESKAVAAQLPENLNSLVVVSSAPHMRRSMLAFSRSLPSGVKLEPYAATTYKASYEGYHPIWLEYLKLLIYFMIA